MDILIYHSLIINFLNNNNKEILFLLETYIFFLRIYLYKEIDLFIKLNPLTKISATIMAVETISNHLSVIHLS